jgi:hypothetical protein
MYVGGTGVRLFVLESENQDQEDRILLDRTQVKKES